MYITNIIYIILTISLMVAFIYNSRSDYGSSFSISIVCWLSICSVTSGMIEGVTKFGAPPQYLIGAHLLSSALLSISASSTYYNFKK